MCHVFDCSFFKRQLEVVSRYSYLNLAYKGLKNWIKKGDADTTKMKRFIHCHLDIPSRDSGLRGNERSVLSACLP